MTLLVADSIGKRYGRRNVLTSASLRAEEGSIRALLGRNGAGKTTLLNIAAGVAAPDHGLIIWREQRMQRARFSHLAREGLMFLPADGLLSPTIRLRQQLGLIAATYDGSAIEPVLKRMRLLTCEHQPVSELSGGERRRAEIAAVLVRRPACLLADEVFRGLAPLDAELVGDTLRSIAASGCAVVVTGHEVPFLMRYADHITWCTSGTTQELAAPSDALAHYTFGESYLGHQPLSDDTLGSRVKARPPRLQAELLRMERERAVAEQEAERAKGRDIVRTWLECLASCLGGLVVIAAGAHVEDEGIGKILLLAGLTIAFSGILIAVHSAYLRGVKRGDW